MNEREVRTTKAKRENSATGSERKIISMKILDNLRKYAEFFADLATHIYELKKYSCSKVGMSCILAAKKIVNIAPIWNN